MSKPAKYKNYYTDEEPIRCKQPGFEHRYICQGCLEEGHVQLPATEALDCKMVFFNGHVTKGQCCCYSKEHGMRKDECDNFKGK